MIAIVTVVALLVGVADVRGVYWLGAAVVVVVVMILLLVRQARTNSTAVTESDGLERLIALCYNDRAMAERLVAGEERRSPGISRRVLVERAIERLRDDRRR